MQFNSYLTLFPKTDEIVRDVRDDVAVMVGDGAATQFWLCVQGLLPQLLQLRVVAVEQEVAPQLLRTIHRAEATVSPETVSLPCTTK